MVNLDAKEFQINTIRIDHLSIHEHHLEILYSADQFQFATKIFYHELSFSRLIATYSRPLIDRIAAHIALFEGMKLCSLYPQFYDISQIAEHLQAPVLDLFVQIYQGVFAQHWYENQVQNYPSPDFIYPKAELGKPSPQAVVASNSTILTGCGGGKDSILAMKILEESSLDFASMQYSHSIYGKADTQHQLIDQVLATVNPVKRYKISIYDDFNDFSFIPLYFPDLSGITAPETPVSIFESLFILLDGGYTHLCLAHEKSANTGNLFWEDLGKPVNHQWGKSFAAEQLLNAFIRENLLSNVRYFSLLQPIYDYRIFHNFSRYAEILPQIHSCNIQKPWCKKCPKCAYVWLGLMAFVEPKLVNAVFQDNLFDDSSLLPIYQEMIGLSAHTPFECIGEIDESRLMMRRCLEKGLTGQALDLFRQAVLSELSLDWNQLEQKYNSVYGQDHAIPDWIFARIKPKL